MKTAKEEITYEISMSEDDMKFLQNNIKYLSLSAVRDDSDYEANKILCKILQALIEAKKK